MPFSTTSLVAAITLAAEIIIVPFVATAQPCDDLCIITGVPSNNGDGAADGSAPATSYNNRSPTLLETWYFISNGYEVSDQNRIQGTKDYGRVVIRDTSKIVEDTDERLVEEGHNLGGNYRLTWTQDNCVIDENVEDLDDPSNNYSERYFLNNVLPNFEITSEPYNGEMVQGITLLGGPDGSGGSAAVRCVLVPPGNCNLPNGQRQCWSSDKITMVGTALQFEFSALYNMCMINFARRRNMTSLSRFTSCPNRDAMV